MEGANDDFLFWLRNSPRSYYAKESEAAKALRLEFGIKRVYPADLFYRTHKVSQEDFLENVRSAENPAPLITALYDDDS